MTSKSYFFLYGLFCAETDVNSTKKTDKLEVLFSFKSDDI